MPAEILPPAESFIIFYFNTSAVARGRVVYQNMGHGSDQLAVLYDGASRHTLDYAAGLLKQHGIGDLYREAFAAFRVAVDVGQLNGVALRRTLADRANDIGVSAVDFIAFPDGHQSPAACRQGGKGSEHTAGGVEDHISRLRTREIAVKLTR